MPSEGHANTDSERSFLTRSWRVVLVVLGGLVLMLALGFAVLTLRVQHTVVGTWALRGGVADGPTITLRDDGVAELEAGSAPDAGPEQDMTTRYHVWGRLITLEDRVGQNVVRLQYDDSGPVEELLIQIDVSPRWRHQYLRASDYPAMR